MKHQDAKLQKGVLKRTKLSGDTNIPTFVSISTKSHTKVSLIFVEHLVKEDVTLSVLDKMVASIMIPRILAVTWAKARMGMPFPIVVEIILMEKELLLTVINPAAFFTEGLIMGIIFPHVQVRIFAHLAAPVLLILTLVPYWFAMMFKKRSGKAVSYDE